MFHNPLPPSAVCSTILFRSHRLLHSYNSSQYALFAQRLLPTTTQGDHTQHAALSLTKGLGYTCHQPPFHLPFILAPSGCAGFLSLVLLSMKFSSLDHTSILDSADQSDNFPLIFPSSVRLLDDLVKYFWVA
jgi:hypothetical protein